MTTATPSKDKRDLIVGAALELIGEEGLGGFTQPRVAKRSGLRQSHLTYYFPTREELLVAVTEQVATDRIAALQAVAVARTPNSKVKALAGVLTGPAQTRLLLALIQTADLVPSVASAFDRLRAGVIPASVALLDAWDIEQSPESLHLLQATSTGIAVLALANGGTAFRPQAEQLLRQFLTGLA